MSFLELRNEWLIIYIRCCWEFNSLPMDFHLIHPTTQEEKNGTVYGCIELYTARNPGRWFTTVFQREYGRIRTLYNRKTAEIQWEYGRETPARFTVEYSTNIAVYGQVSVEKRPFTVTLQWFTEARNLPPGRWWFGDVMNVQIRSRFSC